MAGPILVAVSAHAEWDAIKQLAANIHTSQTPYGECFTSNLSDALPQEIIFFFEGWGKIAAAAATQYAIDTWHPQLIINLGTCGGFEGEMQKGEVMLATKTTVYDILEQMGDPAEAIADYTTTLDVGWATADLPANVRTGMLLSADRDIIPAQLNELKESYGGVAADWESGAIAWACQKNQTPVLILRGVSDTVSEVRAEAYEDAESFNDGTKVVMEALVQQLPVWTTKWNQYQMGAV